MQGGGAEASVGAEAERAQPLGPRRPAPFERLPPEEAAQGTGQPGKRQGPAVESQLVQRRFLATSQMGFDVRERLKLGAMDVGEEDSRLAFEIAFEGN